MRQKLHWLLKNQGLTMPGDMVFFLFYNLNMEVNDIIASYQMSFDDILKQVEKICRRHHVKHLYLFGSYANGTETQTSDIDFVIKDCDDFLSLDDEIQNILTVKKIDLFDYNAIHNEYLKEDIDTYAKKIY